MTRLSPRIKINKNGTVTLSGVSAIDMRSILTSAWLYRHQESDKITDLESLIWEQRIKNILKMLELPKWQSGYEFVPISQLKPHEIAVRKRDAVMNRNSRIHLRRALAEIFNEPRATLKPMKKGT